MSWGEAVEVHYGHHWEPRAWELYDHDGELAGFMKSVTNAARKANKPFQKVHKTVWKPTKKVLNHVPGFKGVYKFYKKNWKWVAVAVAVVITIYSMGAASPILAALKAGYVACSNAVAGLFTAGGGTAAAGGGTTAASGGSLFTAKNAMLAATAAKKLIAGKKCSELSQSEIQAMADADAAGKMTLHPELAKNLGLQGTGATSAGADPMPGVGKGQAVKLDGQGGILSDGSSSGSSDSFNTTATAGGGMPKWVIPAGIGAVLLVAAL